jgi:hypothetical protein
LIRPGQYICSEIYFLRYRKNDTAVRRYKLQVMKSE